jgi:hypothetical protein
MAVSLPGCYGVGSMSTVTVLVPRADPPDTVSRSIENRYAGRGEHGAGLGFGILPHRHSLSGRRI